MVGNVAMKSTDQGTRVRPRTVAGERRLRGAFIAEHIERIKASVRAKVEHQFRVLTRQFCYTKVRYRGLRKNTAQIVTPFALGNLWMARRRLMGAARWSP